MNQSTKNQPFNFESFFTVLFLGVVAVVASGMAISLIYDGFLFYGINQDGFTFSGYKHNDGGMIINFVMGSFFLIFASVVIFLLGLAIFGDYKSYFKKYVIAMPILITLFLVSFVTFESKEEKIVNISQNIYDNIALNYEEQSVFKNSTPAIEYKLALDTKDFEKLKFFLNNPKKLKGLDDADMFNKLLTVQNISNQSVREDFNKIYSDRYITQEEYESFKKNAMESIMQTMTADVKVNPTNDKILLGNL